MSIAIDRLKQSSLTRRVQLVIAAVVVVYVVVSLANGNHGYLYHHAPLGIVLVGVVYGSVYALGAMALILIYRANKFINFALGALGSLVGVLAIGLVKVHGLNYWIALPLAVAVGAGVGALTERFMSWRFRKSSRLIITVASIGLAQLYGGFELSGSTKEHFTALTGAFSPPFSVSFTVDVYTFHSAEVLIVVVVPVVIAFLAEHVLGESAEWPETLGVPSRP